MRLRVRRLHRHPVLWWLLVSVTAGATALVVYTSVSVAQSSAARYDGLTTVAVFTHALHVGDTISTDDVRSESRPRAFLPDVTLAGAPVGRVVTTPVAVGDVASEMNVGKAGLSATAAALFDDEQALSIPIPKASVPPAAGDIVDVIGTFDAGGSADQPPALTVARNARVLSVSDEAVVVAVSVDRSPAVAAAVMQDRVVLAVTSRARPLRSDDSGSPE